MLLPRLRFMILIRALTYTCALAMVTPLSIAAPPETPSGTHSTPRILLFVNGGPVPAAVPCTNLVIIVKANWPTERIVTMGIADCATGGMSRGVGARRGR